MSTINVSNLVIELIKKINASVSEEDILYYTKAIQQLRTSSVFVVNYASDLPAPSTVLGSLYYVNETEILYIATAYGWIEIYNSTINTIFSWGRNHSAQLGTGTTTLLTNSCSPVQEICRATDWSSVGLGYCHAIAVKTTGQIWGWGANSCGQLGHGGSTVNFCSPIRERCSATDWCRVAAGSQASIAVKTSGELWAWGSNFCGLLGDGTTTTSCSPVREFCSATNWCQATAGLRAGLAIKTSGELWAWGYGTVTGSGVTTATCSPVREFCSATDWCQVSASVEFSAAAVKTSGELWAWGAGACGIRGDGTTATRCSPVREFCSATDWCQVSLGRIHGAGLKTSGQLWVWGASGIGCVLLGDGKVTSSCSPVREFCSATNWCQVSVGINDTSAIKTSGELWSWGRNNCGQIGDGTLIAKCSPVREIFSATDWCQVSAGYFTTSAVRVISV